MATKTISVNPDFFSNTKKTKKKKLKHSLRHNFNKLQKNFLKEKMINKIKDFKKKNSYKNNNINNNTNNNINDNTNNNFGDDYDSAVNFMENVIKTKKTKKKKKKKRDKENIIHVDTSTELVLYDKNNQERPQREAQTAPQLMQQPMQQLMQQPMQQPMRQPMQQPMQQPMRQPPPQREPLSNFSIKPDPPYGILKKGKKQLYSKYRKSLKKDTLAFTDSDNFGKEMDINKEIEIYRINDFPDLKNKNNEDRKKKLENLKNDFIMKENKCETFKIKNKKIIKRFLLGKNLKTKKVGILIKNKKTRKLVNRDCRKLDKKKIKTIKKFLVDHALIKVGTSAPESILRNMYTNCYLSGDINNSGGKNAENILMHNWQN
jgi:hypothetical protein